MPYPRPSQFIIQPSFDTEWARKQSTWVHFFWGEVGASEPESTVNRKPNSGTTTSQFVTLPFSCGNFYNYWRRYKLFSCSLGSTATGLEQKQATRSFPLLVLFILLLAQNVFVFLSSPFLPIIYFVAFFLFSRSLYVLCFLSILSFCS